MYALVALNLLSWLTVAGGGWHTTPKFWNRFLLLLVMTPVFLFFPHLGVRRPPRALDRIFGSAFRRTEVRYGLTMNLVLSAVGFLRLYEELTEAVTFDVSRAAHLGLVLCVTAGILRFLQFAEQQTGPHTTRRWSVTSRLLPG